MRKKHRRSKVALSKRVARDRELAALEEREEIKNRAIARKKVLVQSWYDGTTVEKVIPE